MEGTEVDRLLTAEQLDNASIAASSGEESIEGLLDDALFWRFQSNSLAVFVTADQLTTFRLPNKLWSVVDEIARRALLVGGRIYAVRKDDVPGGGAPAAILRYV